MRWFKSTQEYQHSFDTFSSHEVSNRTLKRQGICSICGKATTKVIFLSLPGRFCTSPSCGTCWGYPFWLANLFKVDGEMVTYTGNYWVAMYKHIFVDPWR